MLRNSKTDEMAQTSRKSCLSPGVPLLKELLGESLKDVAMCWKSVLVAAWHLGPAFALRATTSAQAICVSWNNSLLTRTSPANTSKVTRWCLPKAQRGRAVLPGDALIPHQGLSPQGPAYLPLVRELPAPPSRTLLFRNLQSFQLLDVGHWGHPFPSAETPHWPHMVQEHTISAFIQCRGHQESS